MRTRLPVPAVMVESLSRDLFHFIIQTGEMSCCLDPNSNNRFLNSIKAKRIMRVRTREVQGRPERTPHALAWGCVHVR